MRQSDGLSSARNEETRVDSQGLLQMMVDGLCVMDLADNVLYVNEVLLGMLDLTRGEVMGLPFVRVLGPLTDGAVIEKALANVKRLATGAPIRTAGLTFITKGGRPLVVSVSHGVVRDSEGKPAILFAVVKDITERERIEMTLRDSEQKSRELTDFLPQCVFEMDMRGNLTYSNRYGFEAYGYTPHDLAKGMNARRLVIPPDQKRVIRDMRKVVAGGKSEGNEYLALRKDGTTFPVFVYASPVIREGQVVGVRGIALDITRIKKAEEQVLLQNRELSAMAQIVETVRWSFGLHEILTNTLTEMLDILHIRHGDIYLLNENGECESGTSYLETTEKRPQEAQMMMLCEAYVRRAAESGRTVFVKSLPDSKATRTHHNETTIERLKSLVCVPLIPGGKMLGVLTAATEGNRVFTLKERNLIIRIGHTISAIIENTELRQQVSRVEALQELDRLKTELLANVSHELRAPLAAIKGFASSLLREDVDWDSDTKAEFLRTIVRESDRLTGMVNRLLQMSALESGQIRANLSMSHVSEIIDTVKPTLLTLTASHQLDFLIPDDLPPVTADAEMIGEVVVNLLENAVRCSKAGTRILIQAQATSDAVIISVTDEGIGIPSEHLERIFYRFYRVDRGIRDGGVGTGLGLAICKEIISAHNGTIRAESSVGVGSKFTFSLPAVLSDAPSVA